MERSAQTTTRADGGALCFAEWGNLGGAARVLASPYTWLPATRRSMCGARLRGSASLSPLRLSTYDRPGYGGSGRDPGRHAVELNEAM